MCSLCGVTGIPEPELYSEHSQSEEHRAQVLVDLQTKGMQESKPIVLVSVFEHNSNVLPWREAGARVKVMPMTSEGDMDYELIETMFREVEDETCLKVGAFSAGSNISGTLYDVDRLAQICHSFGALAVFDYAAVAPYVNINMSGPSPHRRWKTAI